MSVRAKFKVTRIELQTSSAAKRDEKGEHMKGAHGEWLYKPKEQRTIVMHPVYESTPGSENSKFWDATPTGELKLGTINPAAWEQFELDGEYYLDFTKVEKDVR